MRFYNTGTLNVRKWNLWCEVWSYEPTGNAQPGSERHLSPLKPDPRRSQTPEEWQLPPWGPVCRGRGSPSKWCHDGHYDFFFSFTFLLTKIINKLGLCTKEGREREVHQGLPDQRAWSNVNYAAPNPAHDELVLTPWPSLWRHAPGIHPPSNKH